MNTGPLHGTPHIRSGICRKLHFCMVCGKAYCRKIELDMHLFCHSTPLQSPENPWRCQVADLMAQCPCCLKGFCRRQDLVFHMDNEKNCMKVGIFSTNNITANPDHDTVLNSENIMDLEVSHVKETEEASECCRRSEHGTKKLERQYAIVRRFLEAEKRQSFAEMECDEICNTNGKTLCRRSRPEVMRKM